MTHVGVGHSGEITGVKISPDGQYIISVSNDGAIMCWRYPAPPPTPQGGGVPPLDSVMPRQGGVETVTPSMQSDRRGVYMEVDKQEAVSPTAMEVGGVGSKQE